MSLVRGERGEIDRREVSSGAGQATGTGRPLPYSAWMCGTPGIFTEGLVTAQVPGSLHLLPPPSYGSNPSFTCAHRGYLQWGGF